MSDLQIDTKDMSMGTLKEILDVLDLRRRHEGTAIRLWEHRERRNKPHLTRAAMNDLRREHDAVDRQYRRLKKFIG